MDTWSKTVISGGSTTENVYEYGITGNRDRLLKYNGLNFTYDAMGNPTTYKGKTLIWEKARQLKSYDGVTYTYDAFGLRRRKTVGTAITYYLYNKSKLFAETRDTTTIYYLYGLNGITGIQVNGLKYIFGTNVQGDVTHIYDVYGNLEATYTYDAWGNHTIHNPDGTVNTNSTFIGNINPIRYRGYYFDTETKLYFLQTRYYDAEVGRFINADDVSYLDPYEIGGLNLYAYCGNNPIMFTDPFGTTKWWEWLLAGVVVAGLIVGSVFTGGLLGAAFVGAAIGAGVSLGSQAIFNGELNWGQFALDIGVGAVTGMLGVSGISRVGSMFIGAGIGGVSNIASQLIGGTSFGDINWLSVGISTAVGGAAGWFAGAGTQNVKAVGNAAGVQKAAMSIKAVQNRIASGVYYATERGMKSALTQVTNRMTLAVGNEMFRMFTGSMIAFGAGMAANNLALWAYTTFGR